MLGGPSVLMTPMNVTNLAVVAKLLTFAILADRLMLFINNAFSFYHWLLSLYIQNVSRVSRVVKMGFGVIGG